MARKSAVADSEQGTETQENGHRTRITSPLVDYSALAVEEAPEVKRESKGASSMLEGTPIPSWVRESYQTGQARQVRVPEHAASQLAMLVRQAASQQGIGVSVRIVDADNGDKLVRFQGKEKQHRKPRGSAEDASE